MRLNKYLARSGVASRREADRLIQSGTTMVNGKLILDPAYDVTEKDKVIFDGQKVQPIQTERFIMLNKPSGVLTTTQDPFGRKSVLDVVDINERIFTIGRLDRDTTGLLILTNSGEIANRLMHPRYHVPRIYKVTIEGRMTQDQIRHVKQKVYIGDHEFGRAEVVKQITVKKRSTVFLRLYEGKKREIRRIFYHLNIRLFDLTRIEFGPIKLDPKLKPGQFRELTLEEIQTLKNIPIPKSSQKTTKRKSRNH